MKYKVTERFFSIQGEGYWAGTPMAFLRLSQCPVGGSEGICKSWDGRLFECDTGKAYHEGRSKWSGLTLQPEHHPYTEVNETLSAEEIREWAGARRHLCITGGEPLIYDLEPLIQEEKYLLHIETSGTIDPPPWLFENATVWITVSPKLGWKREWLGCHNEFKVLVDQDVDTRQLLSEFRPLMDGSHFYLQPIEDEDWQSNIKHAIELCEALNLRLSVQLHKYLGLR